MDKQLSYMKSNTNTPDFPTRAQQHPNITTSTNNSPTKLQDDKYHLYTTPRWQTTPLERPWTQVLANPLRRDHSVYGPWTSNHVSYAPTTASLCSIPREYDLQTPICGRIFAHRHMDLKEGVGGA